MITINLLPWREEVKKAQQIRAGIIAGVFAAVALFFVFVLYLYLTILIGNQQARNDYLQSVIADETMKLGALNRQKKAVMGIESQIQFLVSLRKTSFQTVTLLDMLPRIIPSAVTLTKIVKDKNDLALYGKSKSNIQVTYLMETIGKTPMFKQQELTEITEGKNAGIEGRYFQLKMKQQE